MLRVLILSDIHGNFDALEAVLSHAEAYLWKEIWFLGDLGGYGPEPDKCFDLLNTQKTVFLPGNHDLYYAGILKRDFFSEQAIKSLISAKGLISEEFSSLMKALPTFRKKAGITMVHGSLRNPETEYILDEGDAKDNFKLLKGQCCLFGHTHRQECFQREKRKEKGEVILSRIKPEENQKVSYKGKKILINPGSVGQPRDGDPRAAWAILDTKAKEVQFFRTVYDIKLVQDKMKRKGIPEFQIERLEEGI